MSKSFKLNLKSDYKCEVCKERNVSGPGFAYCQECRDAEWKRIEEASPWRTEKKPEPKVWYACEWCGVQGPDVREIGGEVDGGMFLCRTCHK